MIIFFLQYTVIFQLFLFMLTSMTIYLTKNDQIDCWRKKFFRFIYSILIDSFIVHGFIALISSWWRWTEDELKMAGSPRVEIVTLMENY